MGIDGLRTDLAAFEQAIGGYREDIVAAAEKAVAEVTKTMIFPQAIEWTPVESGDLQRTAYVVRLGPLKYQIVYPMDYAVYVHERTELDHDGNTRAKFLQQAMWQIQWAGYTAILADKIDEHMS